MMADKNDAKKVIMMIIIFSMILSFKFNKLKELVNRVGNLSISTNDIPNLIFIITLIFAFLYSAKITKDNFLKFIFVISTLPLAIDTPLFYLFNTKYIYFINIILIMIILSCLLRYIMKFIEKSSLGD